MVVASRAAPAAGLLLRNPIGARTSRAVTASPRFISATRAPRVKDDIGGPGGQQPPPQRPGGFDALRQHWLKIGGGALLLVAAYAYLGGNPRETKEAAKRKALELERAAERKAGISPIKEDAYEAGRNMSEQAGKTMREMSGREKTKQGSFRHE
ncbi:hypothetical protein E4U41_001422 [Claviceps citrina]|nr:hypothetical protein E4U41_001422 [Claviceps citrina]